MMISQLALDPNLSPGERKIVKIQYDRWLILCLCIVFGPLVLYFAWKLLSNWGWWRLRDSSEPVDGHPGLYRRKQFIKTWHGWVSLSSMSRQQQRRESRELRKERAAEVCRTELNHLFWRPPWLGKRLETHDPKHLSGPIARWVRPRIPKPHNMEEDLQGYPVVGSVDWWKQWWQGSRKTRPPDEESVLKMDCSLENSSWPAAARNIDEATPDFTGDQYSTIKRRYLLRRKDWLSGSEEVKRATALQFIRPKPPLESKTEPQHYRPQERRDFKDIESQNTMFMRRTMSLPAIFMSVMRPGLRLLAGGADPRRSHLGVTDNCAESILIKDTSTSATGPEVMIRFASAGFHPRKGENHQPRDLTPPLDAPDLRVPRKRQHNMRQREDFYSTSSTPSKCTENLTRGLEPEEKPVVLDLFCCDHDLGSSGVAGRHPSPAAPWVSLKNVGDSPYEDMNDYEEDNSAYPESFRQESGTSAPESSQGRSGQISSAGDCGSVPATGLFDPSHTDEPLHQRCPEQRLLATTKSSCQLVTPTGDDGPSRCAKCQPQRRIIDRAIHPSVPTTRDAAGLDQGKETGVSVSLCESESNFLGDINRRLRWLWYELSPGFRGPEDNPAEEYPHTSGRQPNTRPTQPLPPTWMQRSDHWMKIRRPKAHTAPLPVMSMPDLDAWRVLINERRTAADGAETGDRLKEILQYHGETRHGPQEGQMDAEAWILRRPPQGFPEVRPDGAKPAKAATSCDTLEGLGTSGIPATTEEGQRCGSPQRRCCEVDPGRDAVEWGWKRQSTCAHCLSRHATM